MGLGLLSAFPVTYLTNKKKAELCCLVNRAHDRDIFKCGLIHIWCIMGMVDQLKINYELRNMLKIATVWQTDVLLDNNVLLQLHK